MNIVESIDILGFWKNKNVSLKFKPDLNFLIGPNGCGKTTIINMLAAALTADIPTLYSLSFEKIDIKLKTIGKNIKPRIIIEKSIDEKMGSVNITYSIKDASSSQFQTYGIESPSDDRIYRDPRYVNRRLTESNANLYNILRDKIEINWLSIHRGSGIKNPKNARELRDESFESTIDQKVFEISRKFSNYFSLLQSKADAEGKTFQEYIFLSLLDQNLFSSNTGIDVLRQARADPVERDTITVILKSLGVSDTNISRRLTAHYKRLEEGKKKYSDSQKLSIESAVTFSDASRLKQIVNRWQSLNSRRQEIFEPKLLFESIINSMFHGKELHFDERNVPMIYIGNEYRIDISSLSSGEKQLFILLGEAVLQEERAVCFISDEPELSLHVNWQSVLFEKVRSLNSNSQIITATHSPDIVGSAQNRIIYVEEFIK